MAAANKPEAADMPAVLSVRRFTLVESTTMTNDQFMLAARRQWLVGVHRLSVQIVAAASSHPLGSSPPQHMSGISLPLDGLLTVPVSPSRTSFPLLIKVVAHPGSGPGVVLGIATVDPSKFFTQLLAANNTDLGASSSDPAVPSTLSLTVPVFPNAGLNAMTIYAVVAMELIAAQGGANDPMSPSGGLNLEYECGPLRLSTLDLYFPAFAQITDGITVSNVICACNTSLVSLWVNVQVNGVGHYTVTPVGGLVLRPGQRAYFAVTYVKRQPQPMSPRDPNAPQAVVLPSASGGTDTVEIYCVEVDTSEAHPPTILTVHDDAPRSAEQLCRPFHYWLNGSCLTNRPLPMEEAVYVRSVLPVFSAEANAQDAMDDSTEASVAQPTLVSTLARGGDNAALVRDRDSGAVHQSGKAGNVVARTPRAASSSSTWAAALAAARSSSG
jgi:hypothetical protein